MLSTVKQKCASFWDDQSGSEAIEMVMTTAMLVTFIMIGIMFLSYIMALNNVNFVTKKICREIETTGKVNQTQMETQFRNHLGSGALINHSISIDDETYHSSGKIEFLSTFKVTGSCDYIVQLINPGNFSGYRLQLPMNTTVVGMSEVYWGP